ncbi:MAG: NYN domain-containing protein [Dehalococcoidia bacterium]
MASSLGCYVFVDGGYVRAEMVDAGYSDEFDPRVVQRMIADHHEQQGYIVLGPYTTRRTLYYDALDEDAPEEEQRRRRDYFRRLQSLPYTHVVLGEVRKTGKKNRGQKGVDVHLAVDALQAASSGVADVIVLVSGDADFVPLVRAVRNTGPFVFVAGVSRSLSEALAQEADLVMTLSPSDRWVLQQETAS